MVIKSDERGNIPEFSLMIFISLLFISTVTGTVLEPRLKGKRLKFDQKNLKIAVCIVCYQKNLRIGAQRLKLKFKIT